MKNIVIFTGSGISAESGLRTFRDSDGLWEEYAIADVATPEAWGKNPKLVQTFYNERRKQVLEAEPNAAHLALVELEQKYNVTVITQNIDDLHERAGSTKVVHLHGEIRKSRSSRYHHLIYDIDGWELSIDSVCEKGFPLRPYIVWFGEAVPMMDHAISHVQSAEILIVIGTSLEVYPAASLLNFTLPGTKKYLIDPAAQNFSGLQDLTIIKEKAGIAVPLLVRELLNKS